MVPDDFFKINLVMSLIVLSPTKPLFFSTRNEYDEFEDRITQSLRKRMKKEKKKLKVGYEVYASCICNFTCIECDFIIKSMNIRERKIKTSKIDIKLINTGSNINDNSYKTFQSENSLIYPRYRWTLNSVEFSEDFDGEALAQFMNDCCQNRIPAEMEVTYIRIFFYENRGEVEMNIKLPDTFISPITSRRFFTIKATCAKSTEEPVQSYVKYLRSNHINPYCRFLSLKSYDSIQPFTEPAQLYISDNE